MQSVYTLIDISHQQVLHQIVLMKEQVHLMDGKEITINAGNYIGTSKGMEGEGFHCVVDWLEEEGLLPFSQDFVIDHDSSVQCTSTTTAACSTSAFSTTPVT